MNIKTKLNSTVEKIDSAFFTLCRKLAYTSLKDLNFKMRRYISIVVDNKFERLLKIRLPFPKRYLFAIFATLQKEYAELSGNKEYAVKEARSEQIMVLARKHEALRACGVVLTIVPDNKDVLEFLEKNRIKATLKGIEGEMKNLEMRITELKAIDKSEKKQDVGKVTIEDYSKIFAVLNKNGYKADIDMPVIDFIQTMKVYKQEVESHNKEMEKLKNRRK